MLEITNLLQFQLFLKEVRVLVSRIVTGMLFQVYVDQRPQRPVRPFLALVLGTKYQTIFMTAA